MFLKQSTVVTVLVGPLVDAANGYTGETGQAGTMTVNVSKNGAALAARNSATAITDDGDGYYLVELDTTDTNTLGILAVEVTDPLTHRPWRKDYQVLPANVYDSLVSGSDYLSTSIVEANGTAISTTGGSNMGVFFNNAASASTKTQDDVGASGSVSIVPTNSYSEGDVITLFQGATYSVAGGNQIDFAIAGSSVDLTGLTPTLTLNKNSGITSSGDDPATFTGSIVNPGASNQLIRFTLDEYDTDSLCIDNTVDHPYRVASSYAYTYVVSCTDGTTTLDAVYISGQCSVHERT